MFTSPEVADPSTLEEVREAIFTSCVLFPGTAKVEASGRRRLGPISRGRKGFQVRNRLVTPTRHDSVPSEDRVRNGAKKLCKSKQTSTQGRMDSFFKAVPSPSVTKRKVTRVRTTNNVLTMSQQAIDTQSKGPAKKKTKVSGSGRGRR